MSTSVIAQAPASHRTFSPAECGASPFLATTALQEFWDRSSEFVLLGQWCLPYPGASPEHAHYSTLPSPWCDATKSARALGQFDRAYETLLGFLRERLNAAHGLNHGDRYWRIVLGPWLLTYVTSMCDHWLHATSALEWRPGLRTWFLDPRDSQIARNTFDFIAWISGHKLNLQMYSEIFRHLGVQGSVRRLESRQPQLGRPLWKQLAYDALGGVNTAFMRLIRPTAVFSDLLFPRQQQVKLVLSSRFRLRPLSERIPDTRWPISDGRHHLLAGLKTSDEFELMLAACLPNHLPTVFLEGFRDCRKRVTGNWPRPPKTLVTSVGWFFNEYFKILAAEATEAGSKLVICQHGGGYGMFEPLHSERHERRVADELWTWGWQDSLHSGAKLRPMPNPRLSDPIDPGHESTSREWILAVHSQPRYPYAYYFSNMDAAHRYPEYLENRERFVAALPTELRRELKIRIPQEDFGWEMRTRLNARFPGLVFDDPSEPWLTRVREARLLVVDNPQTTYLEALAANAPTVLFWDASIWKLRSSALPYLDELRKAGIFYDDPVAAARKVAAVYDNPSAWWASAGTQAARSSFCNRFAYGRKDWDKVWTSNIH